MVAFPDVENMHDRRIVAIDEILVFSCTDDPELAAAGTSEEFLVVEGFLFH
jgi:hypothetical protein